MTTTDSAPTQSALPDAGLLDSTKAALDAAIVDLTDGEKRWAATGVADRAHLLSLVHAAVAENADGWVAAALVAKSISPDSRLVGEEWTTGPYGVLTSIAALGESLDAIAHNRSPIDRVRLGRALGNRVTVPVLPASSSDGVILNGFHAEVWLKPGIPEERVRSSAGLGALHPGETGGIGLVLGAGNVTSIPALDVVYELFANNRVVILKLNPVMDPLLAPFQAAFAPLIAQGLLRIVTGAGDVGGYLAQHPQITHVHITGSAATHDAIVWGTGAEATERRADGTPLLGKPITSELGGVGPVIILPGVWSEADLKYQAEHVAAQRLHNGGYNCIAGQVVVLSADWPQREAFVEQLRIALAEAPTRTPWYPGSDDRLAKAASSYPQGQRVGTRLLIDVQPGADASDLCSTEYFSPVLGILELPGTGRAFLNAAVTTVNDDFVGTLGANIIGLPSTIRQLGSAFDAALERLEYGTIAVNAWTGLAFITPGAPWGAFPGNTIENVQSGIGVVHNAFLLADTEKTILRGPFRPFPRSVLNGELALSPKPPYWVSSRSQAKTGRLLAEYAAHPSITKLPGIIISGFKA
jgi:aldehyde dehydrogenase (NAD(P)+)